MTAGEIAVPPQMQTPQVLAVLKQAFARAGINPAQFTAGSPQASINPQTGMPEFNFMSAFLPAALGIAGSVAAPYLVPEAMGLIGATSLGGGVGTALGGLATGQKPSQALLAGAGSAAGGYALGNLGQGLSAMGGAPASAAAGQATGQGIAGASPLSAGPSAASLQQAASTFDNVPASAEPSAAGPMTAGQYASQNPGFMGAINGAMSHPNLPQSIGSMAGGYLGSQLGAPAKPQQPNYPPGFNTPMTPTSQLPSYQTLLGQNTYQGPRPNFAGYNPATNNTAAYNFFPTPGA